MKIHIIGGSGSGKSFIATRLSEIYNIDHYDLDNIFWDTHADHYGVKMPIYRREKLLSEITDRDDWIIEGVYYNWLKESFQKADYIFLINKSIFICRLRIIKRFIKRKFKLEKGKKESLSSLVNLLRWVGKYHKNDMPEIYKILKCYEGKVIVVKSINDVLKYMSDIR